MKKNDLKVYLLGIVFCLVSKSSLALQPMESLVLGNFSNDYSENSNDPLEFVFGRDKQIKDKNLDDFKSELIKYRGFYEEGKNLNNSCKIAKKISYVTEWERLQVLRTITAETQYIGLDLTTRALAQYAKYFEFSEEEYGNLVEDLVGNYCSNNLTVISKKELKNNLLLKFTKDNFFVLPTVKGNPLFPSNMNSFVAEKNSREQEFKSTVNLFKSLCSWSGDPMNLGLMTPILKHSGIMAFVNRQLNNKSIDWNKEKNIPELVSSDKTVQVICDNLICRKTNKEFFKGKIQLSIGSTSFSHDFQNLYCDFFSVMDYLPKENDPKIAKIMREITFDDENFLVSNFIALLTGYPDFLLGLKNFKDGEELFRASVDFTWSNWAQKQLLGFSDELYFEEPLTMELIDRNLIFNKRESNLKVGFDVNLGEFDRINQQIGKLKVKFSIFVTKAMLKNVLTKMNNPNSSDPNEKMELMNRLKLQMYKDIATAKDRLIIPPWNGDLALLIAKEVTEEVLLQDEKLYMGNDSGMKEIQVEINYSPFALKYLNHQHNIKVRETSLKSMTSEH